jgi:hypothetical protein
MSRPTSRIASTVQFVGELADGLLDLVADLANLLERQILRVRKLPADPAHPRRHRAHLFAAGGDGEIRPGKRLLVELARYVIGVSKCQLLSS